MPPKTASAAWPRRNAPGATARKSNPRVVATTKSASKSIADVSPETIPPSSATPTTITLPEPNPFPSPKTTPLTSPEALKFTPKFTAKAPDESELALTETFPEKINDKKSRFGEGSRVPAAQKEFVAEKAFQIEAAVPDNVGETDQERKTGVRTVVKKTVRVVKKVVKKKVAKRVQKGQAVSSSEELRKVEVVDNEGENPDPRFLGATEVNNCNLLEAEPLARMEIENPCPESYVAVSMEVGNPNSDPSDSNPVFVQNCFPSSSGSMRVKNPVEGNNSTNANYESPVSDGVEANTITDEGEQALSRTATQSVDQNVGAFGSHKDKLLSENVDSGGGEGVAKEEVENFGVGDLKGEVGMGEGLVFSGEMEALERRKRRKTEVFVGGLDKDAQEEDIRNVFQEVGEIMEVRLMINDKTGKNKGFAFVRYATASDAKKALTKFASVKVCGKNCGALPVEGNDTIFLGNIDKKWKNEDIVKLLQEIGIEKIDKVTVVADPSNIGCNRGFAFLELETSRDAQIAYRKLQKKDVFGKYLRIKVAWAEPLSEPDEEEMLKVKSVYAEYLPSSWDEEQVRDYFKKFGDIENVVLARNLRSSKRKDFAFVKYTSREAALACIEASSRESLNEEGFKVNVKVSLAKPLPKGKQGKHVSNLVTKEPPEVKIKPTQSVIKPHQPRNKVKNATSSYDNVGLDRRSSTTDELVQLLREQASWRQPQPGLATGSVDLDYPYSSHARKRPLSQLGDDPLYVDPRGHPRTRFESSFPATSQSGFFQGIGMTSFPYNHQQGAGYSSGALYGSEDYPNNLQMRGGAPHHGSCGLYRRN